MKPTSRVAAIRLSENASEAYGLACLHAPP